MTSFFPSPCKTDLAQWAYVMMLRGVSDSLIKLSADATNELVDTPRWRFIKRYMLEREADQYFRAAQTFYDRAGKQAQEPRRLAIA